MTTRIREYVVAGKIGNQHTGYNFLAVERPAENRGIVWQLNLYRQVAMTRAERRRFDGRDVGACPLVHDLLDIIENVAKHTAGLDLDFKGFGGNSPSIRERMQEILEKN